MPRPPSVLWTAPGDGRRCCRGAARRSCWPSVAGPAAAALAVTWLAAWMAQRSADRTNLAEVLRLAE